MLFFAEYLLYFLFKKEINNLITRNRFSIKGNNLLYDIFSWLFFKLWLPPFDLHIPLILLHYNSWVTYIMACWGYMLPFSRVKISMVVNTNHKSTSNYTVNAFQRYDRVCILGRYEACCRLTDITEISNVSQAENQIYWK